MNNAYENAQLNGRNRNQNQSHFLEPLMKEQCYILFTFGVRLSFPLKPEVPLAAAAFNAGSAPEPSSLEFSIGCPLFLFDFFCFSELQEFIDK